MPENAAGTSGATGADGTGAGIRMTVAGGGGRQLEVLTAAPEDGLPLMFHNGTPGGLVAFGPMAAAAAARGLRTVMYARPGYAASRPQPGRGVAGRRGGGPHTLASAALPPARCLAAASIAGVAPHAAAGLDWLAGMAGENVAEF